jgi:hypothetical protein
MYVSIVNGKFQYDLTKFNSETDLEKQEQIAIEIVKEIYDKASQIQNEGIVSGNRIIIMEVSPELSPVFLKTMIKNRAISELHVKRIKAHIENNTFNLTPQPIIFDSDFKLSDGQHRLHAIIKSKKSIPLYISFMDKKHSDLEYLDLGKTRTRYANHLMHTNGNMPWDEDGDKLISVLYNFSSASKNKTPLTSNGFRIKPLMSYQSCMTIWNYDTTLCENAISYAKEIKAQCIGNNNHLRVYTNVIAFSHFILNWSCQDNYYRQHVRNNKQDVDDFFNTLLNGYDTSGRSPLNNAALKLRDVFLSGINAKDDNHRTFMQIMFIFKCWDNYKNKIDTPNVSMSAFNIKHGSTVVWPIIDNLI